MNAKVLTLLENLAAAHGVAMPLHLHEAVPAATGIDLGDAAALVALDEPALAARLSAAAALPAPTAATLQQQLAAVCSHPGPVALCASPAAATALLLATAAALRPLALRVLLVGDVAVAVDCGERAQRCAPAQVTPQRLADAALLLLAADLPPDQLAALQALAEAASVPVAIDETRTAFRLAPTTVAASLPQPPTFVLLGSALAAGLPFAAVVGCDAKPAADALTRSVVSCVLAQLCAAPIAARLHRLDEQLRAHIDAAAAGYDVQLVWGGCPGMTRLHFVGQEGADGDLIAHHFGLELAAAGCKLRGPMLLPASVRADGIDRVAAAFAHALLRVRALLIEYNSYLSGGIPYVFPGGDPLLRARGVARYRYPKLAEVDVDAHGSAIRIAFAGGDLGPVTSSGFYLPTRLRGDVEVSVRYELHAFAAGPDATCLGLFLQNEASSARYYAQLISTADAGHARSAAAGFRGELLGRTRVPGEAGWLRLCRSGARVTASHRDREEHGWRELGSTEAVADDLIVGAKIWSKVRTDGLIAELFDLRVVAAIPTEQPPLLGERPDPRWQGGGTTSPDNPRSRQ